MQLSSATATVTGRGNGHQARGDRSVLVPSVPTSRSPVTSRLSSDHPSCQQGVTLIAEVERGGSARLTVAHVSEEGDMGDLRPYRESPEQRSIRTLAERFISSKSA
jgi:hypothetical protein